MTRRRPPGKIRRIVQYRLRDQAALDAYLRDQAPRMRAHGVERFGDRFTAGRRVLAHREEFITRGGLDRELPELRRSADRASTARTAASAPRCA